MSKNGFSARDRIVGCFSHSAADNDPMWRQSMVLDAWVQTWTSILFLALFFSRSLIVISSSAVLITGLAYWRTILGTWKRIPLLVPVAVFLVICCLSVLLAEPYPWQNALGKLRYWILYIPLIYVFVSQPTIWSRLRKLGILVSIVVGVVGLIQYFGLPPYTFGLIPMANVNLSHGSRYYARGFIAHHTLFSSVCLLLFHWMFAHLLATARKHRKIDRGALIGSAFALAAIFSSYSRGAWLAWIGSVFATLIFVIGVRSWKWIVLICLVIAGLLAVSDPFRSRFSRLSAADNSERLFLWSTSLRMFNESPLLGKGFHSFATYQKRWVTDEDHRQYPLLPEDAHSIYFDLLGGTGVLGLVSFLFLAASALWSYVRAIRFPLDEYEDAAIIAGFGTLVAALINNLTDTHLVSTYGLCATVFFLARGQSICFRHAEKPIGSISALRPKPELVVPERGTGIGENP